jgi:hypothetical protein
MDRDPPRFLDSSFSCPHCFALAHQFWHKLTADTNSGRNNFNNTTPQSKIAIGEKVNIETQWGKYPVYGIMLSRCYSCKNYCVWRGDVLIYPNSSVAIKPHDDLPEDAKLDFREAMQIATISPRGAAALLRISFERLIKKINNDDKITLDRGIQNLVENGMPKHIQEASDFIRITGNNAIHPGKIDSQDNAESVARIARLINRVVESTITFKNEMSEIYPTLPLEKRKAVDDRLRGGQKRTTGKNINNNNENE